MTSFDVSKYAHSPMHKATILKDYASLSKIILGLPRLCDTAEIHTESLSLAEEAKADAISAVIDRRDVPNRDTPLHLAVKLGDETATEMLMLAGVDWSLQNQQGWSALQEAICNREEGVAKIIVKNYQPLAWAKWCRRLPRLIGTMRRMRDFYMEITFNFESTVIPFISRIAPSDTYKIWKRGANLRADMTLAGFDGFRIQRSDQSILFLGDGSEDGKVNPGSLCVVSHKEKEILNALDGAGAPATEAEVQEEVAAMSRTSIFRPGIDVTQAVLSPQTTWRRHEKMEMVGPWNAKVYDMQNVVVSVRSRRVPGAMTDDEMINSCNGNEAESKDLDDILTEEERRQLDVALNENGDGVIAHGHSCHEQIDRDIPIEEINGCSNGEKYSVDVSRKRDEYRRGRDAEASSSSNAESGDLRKDGSREKEYKKGLRPILWLSPDFPLRTEELLPLLDILANKVKAIRRLREMLTTKLPKGTFPVKVAIPVVPTIRVLVTFTKFEELQPLDEFSTPPSSPTPSGKESPPEQQPSSSSWFQWIKSPYQRPSSSTSSSNSITNDVQDPFAIPRDYTWITAEAKKKKMQEKEKAKKGKSRKQ
ncbi:PREDICTED: ankyrin repeat domain-containing protein 13C-like [Nicotiana attenuata]|uniref:Ankyrin repeat domain-containing protein n=1 Tax=Nicotiana attenuata TaxID=49451 RepID=A0A1J6JM29_NICAT|nr:PREDICTED: ankyrin repeat domain-containing protein 13C-like [Nicotiana attenuata]OIT07953.1 hypothetical protein A4A49_03830 [Nicotiana attenuata]